MGACADVREIECPHRADKGLIADAIKKPGDTCDPAIILSKRHAGELFGGGKLRGFNRDGWSDVIGCASLVGVRGSGGEKFLCGDGAIEATVNQANADQGQGWIKNIVSMPPGLS